jgi:uncharacterized protein (TIGR03084 family)
MAADMPALLSDLSGETQALVLMLESVSDWDLATPAEGWAIRDQVSHLAFFDEAATLALVDPGRFRAEAAALTALGPGFPDLVAERHRALAPRDLLAWFRRARSALLGAFGTADPAARLPWYGPDMSAASAVTARLMETWAHGQDVADALGVRREPTQRLRHIAHLGVRTLGFSFGLRGLPVPAEPVRVELSGPGGGAWGPAGAADSVRGPALDFCLVVTQRRHVAGTALRTTGPVAAQWLTIAQAFAGAPGPGRGAPGPGRLAVS